VMKIMLDRPNCPRYDNKNRRGLSAQGRSAGLRGDWAAAGELSLRQTW
jgi:hypothetical protein